MSDEPRAVLIRSKCKILTPGWVVVGGVDEKPPNCDCGDWDTSVTFCADCGIGGGPHERNSCAS